MGEGVTDDVSDDVAPVDGVVDAEGGTEPNCVDGATSIMFKLEPETAAVEEVVGDVAVALAVLVGPVVEVALSVTVTILVTTRTDPCL